MLMLQYLILLSAVVLVIWLFLPAKPAIQKRLTQPKLNALFEALLYRGANSATLGIFTRDERLRLRFVKYVRRKEQSGFECEISADEWVHVDILSILDGMKTRGVRFSMTSDRSLHIDFEQNVAKAMAVVELMFTQLSGVQLFDDCLARLDENVLPLDVPRLTGVTRPGT